MGHGACLETKACATPTTTTTTRQAADLHAPTAAGQAGSPGHGAQGLLSQVVGSAQALVQRAKATASEVGTGGVRVWGAWWLCIGRWGSALNR